MWKLNKAIDENETSLNANTVHHWSVTPDELPALTSRLLDYTRRVVGSVDAPWSSCTDVAWTTWWSVMPLFRLPVTPWRLSAGSKRKEAKNAGLWPMRIDTRGGGGREGPRALDPPPPAAATASAVSCATRDATACRIAWLIMDLLLAVSQPFHVVPWCHHQGFFYRPVTPNRRGPVAVNRTGLPVTGR
jgi:hypothetical protein